VVVLPAEVPLVAHLLPNVHRLVPGQRLLDLLTLLVLPSLPRREVLQPFPLLPHPPPEVLVLLYDAVVHLPRFSPARALVKLELPRGGVSTCEGVCPADLDWLIGGGFVSEYFGNRFSVLFVVNEAAVVALVEQQLLIHLVDLLSRDVLGVFRVAMQG
jgi:hypothetical protein